MGTGVVGALLDQGAICHVPLWRPVTADGYVFAHHERVNLSGPFDLSTEADAEAFFTSLPPLWASIHVAGGFSMSPLTDTSLADFEGMIAMNAVTAFLCCREAVKSMRRSEHEGGRIVNVSARPAVTPTAGMVSYATSKAAVAAITTSLAEELAPEGIWVNAVLPSVMDTPENRRAMPDADHGSWPSVDEVARTVAFLASPDNAATRGGLVPVYGRA